MNCATLGLYNPYDEGCETKRCKVLEGLENFIYAYFLVEMLIKIVAFGIFGKLGYLSEGWNRLDCFIVIAGYEQSFFQLMPEYFHYYLMTQTYFKSYHNFFFSTLLSTYSLC